MLHLWRRDCGTKRTLKNSQTWKSANSIIVLIERKRNIQIWMGKTAHDRRQREEHLQWKLGMDRATLPIPVKLWKQLLEKSGSMQADECHSWT